jgi:uncharacterized RDD family membrane protein YckC
MPADDRRTFADLPPSRYPGERLGLPRAGSGSVARVGRRLGAIAIDWSAAVVVSVLFFNYDPIATLLVWAVVQVVSLGLAGGSPGHLLFGLRLVALGRARTEVWRPVVRTALLAVVVPALVWDSDQRGFHDKVAGTVLIRR